MALRLAMTGLALGLCAAAGLAANASADDATSSTSVSNPNNCKIVERKPNDHSSDTLSSSVTAGNGKVTAHTTGGHGVTVQSGNGQVSSSVATTGSGGGSTTVTTSDGNCIIYVNPGEKK